MIAGYYDNHGYANMYTGPTNGGVMPITDTSWPTWSDGFVTYPNNPLIASHNGVDGRTIKGSIDDYWVKYGSTANDPYITGAWSQHAWDSAIGDYMKTSQSAYLNTDGSTTFYTWVSDPSRLTCADMVTNNITKDGTYGRKLFYEARGYTVTDCYNQKTDNTIAGGFSLANFQAQIDAGHPVLLNLAGHSIVGYGYDGSTIYIRDTWDSDPSHTYSMPWGGTYSGMELLSVSVVRLQASGPVVIPTPQAPYGTITDTTPTYKWSKITGATQYRFRVYKGTATTPLYTKTITSPSCTTTSCTNTPTNILALASYKWQVQAMVGGVWKAWSVKKAFTVAAPAAGFNSPFTSNATGWSKLNGTWNVAGGFYQTPGLYDKFVTSKHINNYGVLTYTVKMKTTGCSYCSHGIFFNGTPSPISSTGRWNNGYAFYITNDGAFNFGYYTGGSWTFLVPWTDYSGITSNLNTLKVTYNKNTGFMQGYINGARVIYGTLNTYKSGAVGVGIYQDSASRLYVDSAVLTMSAPTADAAADGEGILFDETFSSAIDVSEAMQP